jgi:ubiquinone/menaquinone biosynthesis C-methylase UbiE
VSYIFDNAVEAVASARFDSLESLYDERTVHYLASTGVGPGWDCLEIGGGGGSIATWLSARVGDTGSVLVTDINPRFLKPSTCGNLEIRRHDIRVDELPDESFDLIHARLVFIHISDPWTSIKRLVPTLKPGGWLVIEDFDFSSIDRSVPCSRAEDAALTKKVLCAMRVLMEERELDVEFAKNLYSGLAAMRLDRVGMEGHVTVLAGGSAGARLYQANLSQVTAEAVARKLLTAEEIDCMSTLLESESFAVLSSIMFSAWGQRPAQRRAELLDQSADA